MDRVRLAMYIKYVCHKYYIDSRCMISLYICIASLTRSFGNDGLISGTNYNKPCYYYGGP